MVREKILLDQPGMCEITDFVKAEIGGSDVYKRQVMRCL